MTQTYFVIFNKFESWTRRESEVDYGAALASSGEQFNHTPHCEFAVLVEWGDLRSSQSVSHLQVNNCTTVANFE